MIEHVAAGLPTCTQPQIDARLAICQRCAYWTGTICRKCGCNVNSGKFLNKLGWLDQSCPIGKWGQVDVLLPLTGTPQSGWWEIRGQLVVDELARLGYSGRLVAATQRNADSLESLVLAHSPRLVINRAMYYPPEVVQTVATKHRDVQIVTVNHSSQSHLLHAPHWLDHQRRHIELSSQLPNVWYGLVDERLPVARHERVVWFPNLVPEVASDRRRVGGYVSCIGRWDWAKNWPNQLAACRDLNVFVAMKASRSVDLAAMAETYGVRIRQMPWSDQWQAHIDRLAEHVSIGLQCSFTESFNYVTIDHLSLGIPVIGSPAIRYLPAEWQANPDDPADIRHRLDAVRSGGDVASRCRDIASQVKSRNAAAFAALVHRLLR